MDDVSASFPSYFFPSPFPTEFVTYHFEIVLTSIGNCKLTATTFIQTFIISGQFCYTPN